MNLKERTKLQRMLGAEGITIEAFKDVIGAKQAKTAREKLRGNVEFKLNEMKAVQQKLFPDYSLEELFEGYGIAEDAA